MYSYCTLFDSNYLDKGIVTVDSLRSTGCQRNVYILSMDDTCECILRDYYRYDHGITVISLSDFMDPELEKVRKERGRAEFCWTCTASLIRYVLRNYKESGCTYIDADLYFYTNPDAVLQEMTEAGKEVQIIEHWFRDDFWGRESTRAAGRYCVEFNTFSDTENSLKLLETWRRNTIDSCAAVSSDNDKLGDQYYLSDWANNYDFVHVVENHGAGIASWNLDRYRIIRVNDGVPYFSFDGKGEYPAVFFHFHNLEYMDRDKVNINVYFQYLSVDERTVNAFYHPYLRRIDRMKETLEDRYGIYPLVRSHPGIVTTRNLKHYLKRLFSRRIFINICIKIRNDMAGRNRKKDIIDLREVRESIEEE